MADQTELLERKAATAEPKSAPACRFCGTALDHSFIDLGVQPPCNSLIPPERLGEMEPFYPLHARVCDQCFLVQLEEFVAPDDIFGEYAYFSSYSKGWVRHAKRYAEMANGRFGLGPDSLVIEIASNDGYLLQHFVAEGIPVLGIEPAANVAQFAIDKGIRTTVQFLGAETGRAIVGEYGQADLIAGNNVFAHVPALNDFVAGITALLKPTGVLTLEFPHLCALIENSQFDTIYHEHFSYFSFFTARKILAAHGLTVFDVEKLATHGGSLRVYARHAEDQSRPVLPSVDALLAEEKRAGVDRLASYAAFDAKARAVKRGLLDFLIQAKEDGKSVVGYGAPGKGNTLLNYCGIRLDFLDYLVDANPYKQGRYTPGTRIPIHAPERIRQTKPDFVLILPWNIADEIVEAHAYVRHWGGRFVVPIPHLSIID